MKLQEAWNPVVMAHDREFVNVDLPCSINALIREYRLEFPRAFVVMVSWRDGSGFISRLDWDALLPCGATVRFVELPRGGGGSNPLKIIATIAIMAASMYVPGLLGLAAGSFSAGMVSAGIMIGGSLLLNMFFGQSMDAGGADAGTPDTVYSVSSGGNNLRIGQPFAERFGRFLCYPDLVQHSYTTIEDNEQYLYFYMIIGVGQYAVEEVYVDKTPLLEFDEAHYRILEPGIPPNIVTNLVWTCSEISGQEIDDNKASPLTAVVSGRGTVANYIEYDVNFPQLVGYNDNGSKRTVSVEVVADVRLVDDDGQPLGTWKNLHRRTYAAASKDTLRFSNKCPVPSGPGRYQFRIYRSNAASEDSKVADKVTLIGVRAYGGMHPDYGDVTCLEGKLRASDRLNGDVVNKINVVATRKLYPVTVAGFGPELVATRSIFDAIAYIVTCQNGGRQPESSLLWEAIWELKEKVDGRGHTFNWSFTSQSDVMSACHKAAQCSRMVPCMPGGQFALVRDDYQNVPAVTYTDDDFDEGSFALTYTLAQPNSPTCVKVWFVNPVTWSDDYVLYFDDRGSEDIPYEVTLEGCQDRDQAYEHAAYLYNDMCDNCITMEFTTGLKGHIPSLFKKLAIAATMVDWGSHGKIAAIEDGLIYLSEPVDFKNASEGQLYVTEANGNTGGPYTVAPTENPYCVAGSIYGLHSMQDHDLQATSFLFGPVNRELLFARLMAIKPDGRNKIRLTATIMNDSVYDLPGVAPDPEPIIPGDAPLLSVTLTKDDQAYYATWIGASTVFLVEVDLGSGFTTYADDYQGYNIFIDIPAPSLSVRVTPYRQGVLYPIHAKTDSYQSPAAPTGLTLVRADISGVAVSWDALPGASSYNAEIWVDGTWQGSLSATTTEASLTTEEMSDMGGPWPNFEVRVSAMVNGIQGQPASLSVEMTPLSAPQGLTLQSVMAGGFLLSWQGVTNASGYVLYVGTSEDFVPSVDGQQVYAGAEPSGLAGISSSPPYQYFFKAAATNPYFGSVEHLSFSDALEVSAEEPDP